MFASKKIILVATIVAHFALASNLLWFEEETEDDFQDDIE